MSITTHTHNHFVTELPSTKRTDATHPPLPPIPEEELPRFLEEMLQLNADLGGLRDQQPED